AISVNVNPTSTTVTSGTAQQFSASVSGTSNTSVIWATTSGSISTSGVLMAPSVSAPTYVTVTVKSAVRPDAKAFATVTVNPQTSTPPAVSVSVAPGTALVQPLGTVQFSASVSGSSNTGVTWRAGFGSINASGVYTAPSSGVTDTVIATSQADPTKAASATVTVQALGGQGSGGGTVPVNPSANAYCTSSGTWSGGTTDGPANLP